jgi:hypothetical protein
VKRALLVLLVAACSSAPRGESDWERTHLGEQPREEESAPPAYPASANLLEFAVDDEPGFRFFVDRTSLSAGKDGVMRYVLVARSSEGAQNVTYEGLRCASAEQRVYAVGEGDGRWVTARASWRPLAAPRHRTLYSEFLCLQGKPARSVADAVRAIERSAQPFSKGFEGPR